MRLASRLEFCRGPTLGEGRSKPKLEGGAIMITNFRTYDLAVQFYHSVKTLRLPGHLKNQLLRASSSVVLNLAEGSTRNTLADRLRFYRIAFGSLRECQAALDLAFGSESHLTKLADRLGGCLYKLCNQNLR